MIRSTREAHSASSSFLALGCVGFIASAIALPAAAQETAAPSEGNATRLKGVVVTDTVIQDGPKVDKVESPKYVRPILDTPQTITVISAQTIKQQNLLTLRDALNTLPGITFGAGEGGGGYGDNINLRGQSANTDITIDGVRDSAQYSRTDPFNLEQIEVINGANSVYGGSGSIGGTINLVTKRPNADDHSILSAGIGTDDYYRATVDSNFRLSDMAAVRLNAMYHENDVARRDVDHYKRWGIAPSVKLGVDGPTSLTLLYVHQEDDNTPLYGVPYYKNGVHNGLLPGADYSGYYGYKNVDRQEQTVDQATVIFDHQFSERVVLRNLSRWQRVEQDLVVDPPQASGAGEYCLASGLNQLGDPCAAGHAPGLYYPSGPRGNSRFTENQALYNQLDLTVKFGPASQHTLVIGTSYLNEDYVLNSGNSLRNPDGATPNPALDPINIANPDPVYTGPVNFIRNRRDDSHMTNAAVYAFGVFQLTEQFELNGGLRYERNKSNYRRDEFDTPAAGGASTRGGDQIAKDNLFSYRVAAVYKPVPNASLYVAYSNSKNPTATTVRSGCGLAAAENNFNDPCDIKPEQAVNYEIGGKLELFDSRLLLTASLFRNERTNYRVASNDPLIGNLPVNDGKNRVDGLTLGASGNITDAWAIFANYTYLDTKVKQSISDFQKDTGVFDAQAGNPLTNTPKHSGSLWTTYTLPFGLQIGYGLTYQGSWYLNNARTTPATVLFKADDYLVHRTFLSYPVTDQLTAQLNVQNFTNEKYYTSIRNNGWANPGEGRSAVLSLFYNF